MKTLIFTGWDLTEMMIDDDLKYNNDLLPPAFATSLALSDKGHH